VFVGMSTCNEESSRKTVGNFKLSPMGAHQGSFVLVIYYHLGRGVRLVGLSAGR
jgi:hypothetical protein